MGRVIRAQRRGALGSCFNAATTHKKGVAKLRKFDYAEKNGFVKGVITQIAHDPGRGAPVMKVKFRDPYRNKAVFETMVAPEGVYGGQFIFSGLKSKMAVGNILPVGSGFGHTIEADPSSVDLGNDMLEGYRYGDSIPRI